MQPVQFVCLAHSKKYGKYCVAGLRCDTGEWIRPISKEKHGELSFSDVRLTSGDAPHTFDIIALILDKHLPIKNQPENWSIQNSPWRLICRPAPVEQVALLRKALFPGPALFGNTSDRVSYALFDKTPALESLVLVKPRNPRWIVKRKPNWDKQMRVRFFLGQALYNLAVTDIPYDDMLRTLEPGEYSSVQLGIKNEDKLYFTISLGEPFENGYCFKLVAAVLQLPNGWPALE